MTRRRFLSFLGGVTAAFSAVSWVPHAPTLAWRRLWWRRYERYVETKGTDIRSFDADWNLLHHRKVLVIGDAASVPYQFKAYVWRWPALSTGIDPAAFRPPSRRIGSAEARMIA